LYYELNASVFEEMLTWLYRFSGKQGDDNNDEA
jgi:hypothetical protein